VSRNPASAMPGTARRTGAAAQAARAQEDAAARSVHLPIPAHAERRGVGENARVPPLWRQARATGMACEPTRTDIRAPANPGGVLRCWLVPAVRRRWAASRSCGTDGNDLDVAGNFSANP